MHQGHAAKPSAAAIDAQCVKTSTSVPTADQGVNAAKKIVGRNAASWSTPSDYCWPSWSPRLRPGLDRRHHPHQPDRRHPSLRATWADGSNRQYLVEHTAALGIGMQIAQRRPGTRGSTPLSHRWVVERTLGWLMLRCRLTRDYKTLPASSAAMIHIAMTDLMTAASRPRRSPARSLQRAGLGPSKQTPTRRADRSRCGSIEVQGFEAHARPEDQNLVAAECEVLPVTPPREPPTVVSSGYRDDLTVGHAVGNTRSFLTDGPWSTRDELDFERMDGAGVVGVSR
ncbi:transposase [Actinomadura montaniterrae]|uniref:Transposase n=1 Tax=Actinomadura montaniterrae TaxID=1803903 RepID=A0A6L3VZZ4_9ACTN|nr:transposase [Actinomadura montaniterrae]KAB2379247.1 transposase [Actinomadura montaniterrae]